MYMPWLLCTCSWPLALFDLVTPGESGSGNAHFAFSRKETHRALGANLVWYVPGRALTTSLACAGAQGKEEGRGQWDGSVGKGLQKPAEGDDDRRKDRVTLVILWPLNMRAVAHAQYN